MNSKLIQNMEKTLDIPEIISFNLGFNNNLIKITGYFDKSIITVHDYAIIHFNLIPLLEFQRSVLYVLLNFSDESLNKIIYLNKDTPVMFSPDKEYKYSGLIYLNSDKNSEVILKSISVMMNLSK